MFTGRNNSAGLFGLKPGEFDGRYESMIRRVHPEDRAALEASIAGARDRQTPHRHEFRAIWPDGSIHWLAVRAHSIVTRPAGRSG